MISGSVFSYNNLNESPEKSFNNVIGGTQRHSTKFYKPVSR